MSLPIGDVAKRTGLAVSAVRYYDRIGLIAGTARVGGKRRFTEETVGRVNFIRRARDLGFSLEEIRAVLDDGANDWRYLLDAKRSELIDRRDRLDVMLALLDEIAECGCEVVAECPAVVGAGPAL